jgi:adenylate kinase family enzyme
MAGGSVAGATEGAEPRVTPVICVLGPPGSGKTETSAALVARVDADVVHGGKALRTLVGRDPHDSLAKRAENIVSTGRPVPVDLYCEIVGDCARGNGRWLVLDGYPRNAEQYRGLPAVCHAASVLRPSFFGVFLTLGDSELHRRIGKRRRTDDISPELVDRRLKLYADDASELQSRFRSDGRLLTVSGAMATGSIVNTILRFVSESSRVVGADPLPQRSDP